jgi:protein-tyrosine phosphatase
MIDIHSHVLPAIDDGADDLATAVAMCRLAAADGCTAIVATPHQRTTHWDNSDLARLEALRRAVADELGDEIELHLGGEVRVDSDFLADLGAAELATADPGEAAAHGPASLAGSRYLLLELDRHQLRVDLRLDPTDLVHELVVAGWRPIFAHPEFIPMLARDLDLVADLAAAGALFQLTAMSLTGDFGRTPRQVCHDLLDRGLAHFVASDAHGVDHRPPGLSRARRALAERWGEETAERLTRDNPRAVLDHRPLAAAVPAPVAARLRV